MPSVELIQMRLEKNIEIAKLVQRKTSTKWKKESEKKNKKGEHYKFNHS